MLQKIENLTFNELPEAISQLMKDVNELKSLLQTVHDAKVEPDRWFDIDQLCQYVPDKPAKQTVYGWVAHHTVPYHKKGKKLQFLKSRRLITMRSMHGGVTEKNLFQYTTNYKEGTIWR